MSGTDYPAALGDELDPAIDYPAIFPRSCRVPSEFMRMRRHREVYEAARARERGPIDLLPARLPAEYRLAQIDQAVARGWQGWEIAALVPGPVTDEERRRVVR